MRADNQCFKVVCAGEAAEIYLYDVIGEDFFGGISARMFADELGKLKGAKQIDVRINSPGGDVFAGNTIFTLLKSHPAKVNVYVDGLAASIASVIAMAGDSIEMSSNAMLMIHNPFGASYGTAEEHRKLADLLDKVKENIVDTYVSRTKLDPDKVMQLMDDETWFTAGEAIDAGLADRVGAEQSLAACIRPDLFKFKRLPEALLTKEPEPEPEVTYENQLRREILKLKR